LSDFNVSGVKSIQISGCASCIRDICLLPDKSFDCRLLKFTEIICGEWFVLPQRQQGTKMHEDYLMGVRFCFAGTSFFQSVTWLRLFM
jgi:hypothetical protein